MTFSQYFIYELAGVTRNVESHIDAGISIKQFILLPKSFNTHLRFVNAKMFVLLGTLKSFKKDFGQVGYNKDVFSYEIISTSYYNYVQSKQEPFAQIIFFSSLHQRNLLTSKELEHTMGPIDI